MKIKLLCASIALSTLLMPASWAAGLVSLSDEELSDTEGQALFNLSYLAPSDAGNFETANNIGFYRLGLEAQLDLNINARKLQLGCGGINGAGGCDIDIDNLSLSGLSSTREGRASSSAQITNPFMEFAIKNPNSASTREITGFRLSAEQVQGLLTAGTENSTVPNGINSFSGFMRVQSGIGATALEQSRVRGFANTAGAFFDAGVHQIEGNLVAIGLANASFRTTGGGFFVPAMNRLPFQANTITVNSNRVSAVPIASQITVPQIELRGTFTPATGQVNPAAPATTTSVITQGGPVDAVITGCSNTVFVIPACLAAPTGRDFSNIQMSGFVQGITADVTINQSLGYIHSLPINSAAYLALQSMAMRWPGSQTGDVAQPGWWLAFADPVNLGEVNPTQLIDITPLFPQLATAVGDYLQANPATTNDLGAVISGDGLAANIGTVNLAGSPLSLLLNDLQLSGQNFAPNCYGNLTFC